MARLKKMRANLKILKKETSQNTLFDPWDTSKRAFVPAGSSARIRALQRQIRLEESNPTIDIPPLILQFKSKSIVFPWLFERTKKSAPFNFMVFTQKKILQKRLQQFRSTHLADKVTLRSYSDYKSNFAKMKGMPKKVKRMMRRFGFRAKDKIYVQKIGAHALSHKEAVQKNLPDIEFILESASAPILMDH